VNPLKATKSARLTPLLNMKFRLVQLFLLIALVVGMGLFTGCATDEPDNASVRPWNTPQGWENGIGGMDTQHR